MRAFYTRRFLEHYAKAPLTIQRAVDRRIALLVQNLRHPSLRAKKYDEVHDIWQARVNGGWRFYFTIEGNLYRLLSLLPHPK
jgi:plasmid maintenance system killer protein